MNSKAEFIALMASLMAIVALAIDAMLPALSFIATDLQLSNDNDRQLVVIIMFIGLGLGQFIYGPISDSVGRKPVIICGLLIFLASSIVCIYASSFYWLLIGRFFQGLGAAAARNIAVAIVRDGFTGDEMARMMSIILAVFVSIPMVAPALGELVLTFASWRMIFVALFIIALVLLIWFVLRQPETLAPSHRQRFSIAAVFSAFKQVLSTPVAVIYTLISGLTFGSFLVFLSSSQQLLQEQYMTGKLYAAYFAMLVSAFCLAAIVNSRFVTSLGAATMAKIALIILSVSSLLFILPAWLSNGQPMFILLILYLLSICFGTGLLMGNTSALALEPLGHIAGTAAAIVGGVSTLIAACVGVIVGQFYAGNVYPYIFCFLLMSLLSLGLRKMIQTPAK